MLISNPTPIKKWTIHGILQNIGFYPPTENPCVMMRENPKTKSSEYIVIYQDDLYIASTTPEKLLNILQNMYKINIYPDNYLGSEYPQGPGRAMICQLRKYLEKLCKCYYTIQRQSSCRYKLPPHNHEIIDHQEQPKFDKQ